MSFFAKLFGAKKPAESVVLIEISPDSIAGGLVWYKPNATPLMVYASRMPIVPILGEEASDAVSKTLRMLGEMIIREGAPRLAHVAGSGRIHAILVSVKAPWQETIIRSEKIERTAPFTFSRSLLSMALSKSATPPPGRLLADEFIVSTLLDGYPVQHPVGKRVRLVNITVLASFIDQELSLIVAEVLRAVFHTEDIRLVAAAALRHAALRTLFPLEREYVMVDIAGDAVVTALVRGGSLAAVEHATASVSAKSKEEWLVALQLTFEAITKRYPLPRKIFLIAGETDRARFKEKVEAEPFSKYSLSQDPPLVVPVAPTHLTDQVQLGDAVAPDLGLELMVIFWHTAEH
jgi:hypothetical protein